MRSDSMSHWDRVPEQIEQNTDPLLACNRLETWGWQCVGLHVVSRGLPVSLAFPGELAFLGIAVRLIVRSGHV